MSYFHMALRMSACDGRRTSGRSKAGLGAYADENVVVHTRMRTQRRVVFCREKYINEPLARRTGSFRDVGVWRPFANR